MEQVHIEVSERKEDIVARIVVFLILMVTFWSSIIGSALAVRKEF